MFFFLTFLLGSGLAQGANILGVFLFPSISHQVVYQAIYRELSLRGHQVTVLTPNPTNDPSLTNLTEISVNYIYEAYNKIKIEKILSKDRNLYQNVFEAFVALDVLAEMELNNTQFKKLIADKSQNFDLILAEYIHPVVFGLVERYEAPIIGVSSFGALTAEHHAIGNPILPVLDPDHFLNINFKKLSMWEKIQSLVYSLWARYHHASFVYPRAHKIAQRHFGDGIDYVGDLARTQSLLLHNSNPTIHSPRPHVPSVVETGFVHIRPNEPLPEDLQQILDEAVKGVVYFSLGSNVKSMNIPEELRGTIVEALSELPYKVLWKWESDHLPGKPENVVIRKWLPQQDVLAHPNVKVFVTQGGLQSTEEAITRRVPMVGMPFVCDQPMNVQKVVDLGIGLGVDPGTVTKDELKRSIIEVAENERYRSRIKEVCDLVYDRPMSGLEKAVWWSEYVIRHKGALQLRSARADMSWFHYLLVDVILTVIVSVVVICMSYKVLRNS